MTVQPEDIIIISGDVDSYAAGNMIIEASKKFPNNKVVFIPEGATLRAMGKEKSLEFLDTMKKFIEGE